MAFAPSHTANDTADLDRFKELLVQTCGHSFEKERRQTLSDSLRRRMAARGVEGHEDYYDLLLHDVNELLRLTELLTVNETYFFREPDHLNLMVDTLVPELLAARSQRPIRILSAGCSTGEEPYSVAIMLRERFGPESEQLFAITGVDIDSTVIASAKLAIYGKSSFRGTDQGLLERHFTPCGADRYQVGDTIRRQVGFEVANLLGASYPQRMQMPDIILYRNVSIYFPQQVQREVFTRLSELLAEGGCLLVGATETIHHDIGILSLVQQNALFFYRKKPALIFAERRASSRSTPPERQRGAAPPVEQANRVRAGLTRSRVNVEHTSAPPMKPPQPPAPFDVRERFDAAIEHAHNGQHDKALAIVDAILQCDGTFRKAYCLKGSLLLSESRFDEARTVCEGILSRDPLSLEAYLMLGMIARQHGDDETAFKRFREAVYLDASCWPAHFHTAEMLYARQDTKRARNSYEAALRVLEKGTLQGHGQTFFPLSFNAEQFLVICRHKLSLLKKNG